MSSSSKAKLLLDAFSHPNAAAFLAAASTPASVPKLNGLPEVIIAGRANVGKSTFLNALMGRKDLVHSSKKAGRTRTLNFYRVGREPGSFILVDSPGYGARGRADWGTLWEHYIDTRKELRGIFVLINALHGVTDFDRAMLGNLNDRLSARAAALSAGGSTRVPVLQPIFTKVDRMAGGEETAERIVRDVKKLAPFAASPILSAVTPSLGIDIGMHSARWAICSACAR